VATSAPRMPGVITHMARTGVSVKMASRRMLTDVRVKVSRITFIVYFISLILMAASTLTQSTGPVQFNVTCYY